MGVVGSGIRQRAPQPEVFDLSVGQPAASLLPVTSVAISAQRAWRLAEPATLEYGNNQGPEPLRRWLAARFSQQDGVAVDHDQILLTAGCSHALELLCHSVGRSADVVLLEAATYNLGVAICRQSGLVPIRIDGDDAGISPEALRQKCDLLVGQGRAIAFLYLQPAFNNPTGMTMKADRRQAILDAAHSQDVLIVEDESYRELAFEGAPPPSLWALGSVASVRIGTFSKTVGPGLRLGWVAGPARSIAKLSSRATFNSGGGIAHLQGLAMGDYCTTGEFRRHLDRVRIAHRRQAEALLDGLRDGGLDCSAAHPLGGYFHWLRLPSPQPRAAIEARLKAHGVLAQAGSRFCSDDERPADESHIRLCWSAYEPEQLHAAGRSVARAVSELCA